MVNRGEMEQGGAEVGVLSHRKSSLCSGQTGQCASDPGEEGQESGISGTCTPEGQTAAHSHYPQGWIPCVPGSLRLGGPGSVWRQSKPVGAELMLKGFVAKVSEGLF